MVVKRSSIVERLKELDVVVQELSQYEATTLADLGTDLSRRWVMERRLSLLSL